MSGIGALNWTGLEWHVVQFSLTTAATSHGTPGAMPAVMPAGIAGGVIAGVVGGTMPLPAAPLGVVAGLPETVVGGVGSVLLGAPPAPSPTGPAGWPPPPQPIATNNDNPTHPPARLVSIGCSLMDRPHHPSVSR